MQGWEAEPGAVTSLDMDILDDRTAHAHDLVTLHESIARLLAVQGNYKLAYSHLNAALRLARDRIGAEPIVPAQYRHQVAELRRAHAEAVDASLRDALTATYNRRYLDEQLAALAARASSGLGIAVAMIDLDHFKQVNDTFGHRVGDRVLQAVVPLLQADLPDGAFCARYGGEEFVVVLPEVTARDAVVTVERARARVARHPWEKVAPALQVTISAGLVHSIASEQQADGAEVDAECQLRRADDLLYAAKRAGRNAVAYRLGGAIRIAGLDDNCR